MTEELKERYDDLLITGIALRNIAKEYEAYIPKVQQAKDEGREPPFLHQKMIKNAERARRLLHDNEVEREKLSKQIREIGERA